MLLFPPYDKIIHKIGKQVIAIFQGDNLDMISLLIVDDSVFSQKVVANSIKKIITDIEINFASDGEEGFECYKELKPDFVISDLLMPKVNGEGLIRLIKAYDTEAKLIVLSADVQKNVREDIESYNVLSFVNKPLNEEKTQHICGLLKGNHNG